MVKINEKNKCGNNKGKCDKMWIVKVGEGMGVLGYRCECKIGWMIGSEKRKCKIIEEFIMY